ncbi:hypothetical protein Tco_0273429 [Tanacetum coccineum]
MHLEVISKWKAGFKDDMDARSDVYVLSNNCRKCSDDKDEIWATKGLLNKAKGNVLGMEIVRNQGGNYLRCQSGFTTEVGTNFREGKFIKGVLGVHDEKRVWFEVELQGAQRDREAKVFRVSNEYIAVAQRRLKDKQPKEKKNTDCLVKEQEKEYQTRWKTKMGNVLDSCNQRSTQQCIKSGVAKHLGVVGLQQQNGLVDETNVTLFAKLRSSAYHKSIVGSKLWRLDDVTSKVVLYKNMDFNESGEYKKTFIGSGVGTGSMQVLHEFEFEMEQLGDHTFEMKPQENVDQGAGLQEVQTQDLMDCQLARDREQHLACELFRYREDNNEAAFAVAAVEKIYAHASLTFNNTVACEVISKWNAGLKDDMDAQSNVYVLSNSCRKCNDDNNGYYWDYTPSMFIHLFLYIDDMVFSCGCKAEIWATKGLLDKAKGNVLGMEIVRDKSGNTLRVSQSRIYNGKLVQTLLEGHSILSLEGNLSRDYDVERMVSGHVYMRLKARSIRWSARDLT